MDGNAVWSLDIFTFAALGNGIVSWSGRYIKNEKMVLFMQLLHPELYDLTLKEDQQVLEVKSFNMRYTLQYNMQRIIGL